MIFLTQTIVARMFINSFYDPLTLKRKHIFKIFQEILKHTIQNNFWRRDMYTARIIY